MKLTKIPGLIVAGFLFCMVSAFAKPVSQKTAMQAALNFLQGEASYVPSQPLALVSSTNEGNGYYIFSNDKCFVIISADDAGDPILGYSTESGFQTKNVSPEVSYLLHNYSQQMQYIVKNNIAATSTVSTRWSNLVNNTLPQYKNPEYVTTLSKTTWDQAPYYNDLCPFDNYYNQRTVTGCVATAMAQVMKYWNYPARGTGSNSYTDNSYGTLSATFSSDDYEWDSMPAKVSVSNDAVARLMYDCGVAINMNYGVASTGGSGAQVIPYGRGGNGNTQKCALNALINNFGYDATSIKGLSRNDYPVDSVWMDMLQTELVQKHPIIYSGFDSTNEGHCFVFDGYNFSSNHYLFHVNWGWSGMDNGFFTIDKLNPGSGQIGAGAIGEFNLNQSAILGIQPPLSQQSGFETVSNPAGNVNVFPNPANDKVTVDLSGLSTNARQIDFMDIQGKLVYSEMLSAGMNSVNINTSSLTNGIYIMQVISDKGVVNSRLVIAR